jgi:hypothetical protein
MLRKGTDIILSILGFRFLEKQLVITLIETWKNKDIYIS